MRKMLLLMIAIVLSVSSIGQKFQAISTGASEEGTPVVFLPGSLGGQELINPNPETDYLGAWVVPALGSSSGNTRIPGNTWRYQETEYLISAAEMLASGFPSGVEVQDISWIVLTAGATTQTGTLNIWLMNTTDAIYSLPTAAGFTTAGFTLVHSSPSFTVPITAGTYTVPFSGGSPFIYTGGGVYVAWNFSNPLGPLGTTALIANCNNSVSGSLWGARSLTAFGSLPPAWASTAFRPATAFGNSFYTDILSVTNIYTVERTPIPFGVPTPVDVRVLNTIATPVGPFDVTLTIKDATNTIVRYTSTQTVATLAGNAAATLNFSWTPTVQEDVNITATATAPPGENFLPNNTRTMVCNVNGDLFSYNYASVSTGAVGWNAPYAAIFASKYQMTGGGTVTGVKIQIGNSAGNAGQTVSAVVLNKQGNVVAESAPHVIDALEIGTNVLFTFPTNPNIAPEEFYVGLATTPAAATYYPMGYFGESPTRPDVFYRFELGGSTPAGITGYKFGLEAVVAPFAGVIYPRNFAAAPAGPTQIDLSWLLNPNGNPVMIAVNTTNTFGTPVDGTTYPVSTVIPGGGTVIYSGAGSTFSHTGLTAGTIYYYQAWSVDGSTVYSSKVYTSEATYFPVPYTQDFEVATPLPPSWTGNMSVDLLHGTAGSKGMTFDLFPDPDYLTCTGVSPNVVLPATQCKTSFDYRLTDWVAGVYPGPAKVMAAGDKLEVQYSTNSGGTWTTLHTIDMTNHVTSVDFVNVTVNLPIYAGAVMVRFLGTWGAGDYYVDIDNFVVEELPLCAAPTLPTVGSITTTSASIGWTGPSVVVLDYGTPGHTAGSGTIINPVVTNPYTLGGLAPGQSYDVYLRQECGVGIYSTWTGPLNFTTLAILNITPNPNPFNFGTVNVGATSGAQIFTIQNNGAVAILIDGLFLEGANASDFTLTDSHNYAVPLAAGTSYTVSVVFHPASTGAKVAYLRLSENETDHFVNLAGTGACLTPSALTAVSYSATSATLGWNANGTTAWEIEYGPAGFTQGAGTTVTAGTNPYVLAGLTANTAYGFYVRAICTPGIYSAWAGPATFASLCTPAATPFVEDFELAAFPPACWSRTTGTQLFFRTTAASGYGTGTASVVANFYSYASPAPFHLLTMPFDASTVYAPVLKFDYAYATYTDGSVDELDVYYSTDNGATFTMLLAMPGGFSGILNTAGNTGSSFVPLANQWATQTLALPAGTNMVRFTGISGYGNNLFLDNVKVQSAVDAFTTVTGSIAAGTPVCFNATNTITVGPLAVPTGASVTFVAGQKISFLPGTAVAEGAYMHGYIAPNGPYCGGAPARPSVLAVTEPTTQYSSVEQINFSIFPNPTNGNFTLVQKGDKQFGNVKVEVYGMRGNRVLASQMIGEKQHEFSTSDLPVGLYFVKVVAEDYTETIKLIVTR